MKIAIKNEKGEQIGRIIYKVCGEVEKNRYIELESIQISSEYQRQGYGVKLTEKLVEKARELKAGEIYCFTTIKNTDFQQFLIKCNFTKHPEKELWHIAV